MQQFINCLLNQRERHNHNLLLIDRISTTREGTMTKILVIEDEETVRENILELLDAEGFEAIAAENGRIGLSLAQQHLPDLILCDVRMPELDGYGVLSALRSKPETATIPFLFLTAKAAKTDLTMGLDLGANAYITKPFTLVELLSAIEETLQSSSSNREHVGC